VVALPPGDEVLAFGLAFFDEVLAGHLQCRLDGFGTAGQEVDPAQTVRSAVDQRLGEVLGRLGGEERGMRERQPFGLGFDRGDDVGVAMPETRHRRAAGSVEVAPAFGVDDVDSVTVIGHRQPGIRRAVEDMRYFERFPAADRDARG